MAEKRRSNRRTPLRKPVGSVWADFGFTKFEVFRCEFCGNHEGSEIAEADPSLICFSVPITALCPVAGLVGVLLSGDTRGHLLHEVGQ